MALTPSTMLEIGTKAPDFQLEDAVSGRSLSLADFANHDVLLVMFVCNHCPFVVHIRPELKRLDADFTPKGLGIVAINSNDVEKYPQDAPVHMKALAEQEGWSFPFLLDETQEVAKAYRAACTPDFYVFDRARKLVYRGRLDASRPGAEEALTGQELRAALDAALSGGEIPDEQIPSVGCNIKWKPGHEPDYFG